MALTQKAEDLFELPQGTLTGEASIELNGRHRVTVTGSCEVREYEDSFIRLMTRSGEVRINGDALALDNLHRNGVSVLGRILSVEFL